MPMLSRYYDVGTDFYHLALSLLVRRRRLAVLLSFRCPASSMFNLELWWHRHCLFIVSSRLYSQISEYCMCY